MREAAVIEDILQMRIAVLSAIQIGRNAGGKNYPQQLVFWS
jgi:hypothetical protein